MGEVVKFPKEPPFVGGEAYLCCTDCYQGVTPMLVGLQFDVNGPVVGFIQCPACGSKIELIGGRPVNEREQ